jgi:serine/threonine protein kinase
MEQVSVPRFGKYIVIQRIGVGGMAEIFKCRLPGIGGFDKLVVVKRILPDQVDDPNFLHMFLDEARVAANLNHPNIAQTYEISEAEGVPLIAMEYVNGPTFGQLLKAQRKTGISNLGASIKILAGVCSGLQAAHNAIDAQGQPLSIVHRDVTPHNILVALDGTPKLVDFGVAKAKGNLAVTNAGGIKGKIWYMAPEQFHANDRAMDHRLDVFSVGVCLYQAATGQLPYQGANEMEVMYKAAEGKFPKPSELWRDIPAKLERIILWAMEPDKNKRCPDCASLGEALEKFVASGPYATNARQVSDHVREVFPTVDINPHLATGSGLTPSGARASRISSASASRSSASGSSGSGSRRVQQASKITPLPTRSPAVLNNRALRLVLFAGAMALVFNGTILFLRKTFRAENPYTASPMASAEATAPETAPAPRQPSKLNRSAEKPSELAVEEAKPVTEQPVVEVKPPAPARQAPAPVRKAAPAPKVVARASAVKGAQDGRLTVLTEPPAMVYLNNEPVGKSPIRNMAVKAGVHHLSTELSGYLPQEKTVIVASAKESLASLRLSRDSAWQLESEPVPAAPAAAAQKEDDHPAKVAEPETPKATPPPDTAIQVKVASLQATPPPARREEPVTNVGGTECPDGTFAKGAPPPKASSQWCQLPDGQKHGRWIRWYANGAKAEEGEYRQGRKHGRWTEWYENGSERERTEWRKGVKAW